MPALWRGIKLLDRGHEGSLAEKQQLEVITFQETMWNAREGSAPFLAKACLRKSRKTQPSLGESNPADCICETLLEIKAEIYKALV